MDIDAERFGVVASKRGRHCLPELRARLERIRSLSLSISCPTAGEDFRHEAGCRSRDGPEKEREIEIVRHQGLGRQSPLVALGQTGGEPLPPCRTDARKIPPSDEMRPKRYVGACNVSPGHVQALVPVI